jgi:hypothetical protein
MRPNLFRSVSNALEQSFPLLPRIRRSCFGLMLFCVVFIIIGLSDTEGLVVPVKPVEKSGYESKPVAVYNHASITLGGQLSIKEPDFMERILLPNQLSGLDMISLLFLAIISLIVILIIPKINQSNLFRSDISDAVRLMGYLMMAHSIFSVYRKVSFIPQKIESLTNHEFTFLNSFPFLQMAEIYFALIVLAMAGIYKRGIKLQEEQDLTV